eukprot:7254874-Prymnesium_polylepis.1
MPDLQLVNAPRTSASYEELELPEVVYTHRSRLGTANPTHTQKNRNSARHPVREVPCVCLRVFYSILSTHMRGPAESVARLRRVPCPVRVPSPVDP